MKNELSTFEAILDEMNRKNAVVCYVTERDDEEIEYSIYDHELTDPAEMDATGFYSLTNLDEDVLEQVTADSDYSNVDPEDLVLYDNYYMYTLDEIKDIVKRLKND